MPCLLVGKTVMEVFSPSPNHHPLLRPSPSTTVLSDNPPSLIVWSNHKSPKPLVFTKCKDSGLKLEQSIVGECQLIGQVEDKYLATVCGSLLVLWDQHAVHERIRLEEMMASTLTPGVTHSLRTVALECSLLGSLPTEEETLAVLSRSGGDWGWWGQRTPPP